MQDLTDRSLTEREKEFIRLIREKPERLDHFLLDFSKAQSERPAPQR